MQRIVVERRLERLVVLRERAFRHLVDGEETRHAFRVHDERIHAFLGRRVGLEVRHVRAGPFAVPFHAISLRFGSHGLPARSQEARLYRMRRLAGQANAQLSVCPRPNGSELSRRAIRLPFSVQRPQKIQQPHEVEPSSRKLREAVQLLAGLDQHLGLVLGIGHIGQAPCRKIPSPVPRQKANPAGGVSRSGSGSGRGKRRRPSCTAPSASGRCPR